MFFFFNFRFRLIKNGVDLALEDFQGFNAHQLAIILEKEHLLPYLNDGISESEVTINY